MQSSIELDLKTKKFPGRYHRDKKTTGP